MRLLLEPTAEPAIIDGVLCRLWTGHDEDGIPVHAWIMHVSPQTHDPQALRKFDQRLHEIVAPNPIGVIYTTKVLAAIPAVTAPPPYHAVDPNYDDPDARGIT